MINVPFAAPAQPAVALPREDHPDELALAFSAWFLPYVDPYGWGWGDSRGRTGCPPGEYLFRAKHVLQRLDQQLVASHLRGVDRLLYRSRRDSGFALLCIDIDAHGGQRDALSVAEFITQVYFEGAYFEPSLRGYHVYVLVRVGRCAKAVFNQKVHALEANLARIVADVGYRSTVKVMGGFTLLDWKRRVVLHRARMAPVPLLPRGVSDLNWLCTSPVFLLEAMDAVQPLARPLPVPPPGESKPASRSYSRRTAAARRRLWQRSRTQRRTSASRRKAHVGANGPSTCGRRRPGG